jgi:hypothetical protein
VPVSTHFLFLLPLLTHTPSQRHAAPFGTDIGNPTTLQRHWSIVVQLRCAQAC